MVEGSEIWCPALAVAPRTSALPPAIALPTSPHCSTSRIRPEHPGGPEASTANKESSAPSSCPVALCLHPATSWTSGTPFSTPPGVDLFPAVPSRASQLTASRRLRSCSCFRASSLCWSSMDWGWELRAWGAAAAATAAACC